MRWISAAARMLIPVPALIALTACCSYTVAPTGAPMIAAGGTFPVNVTTSQPNCSWTFQSNDPWITVGPDPDSTGQTGQGNGRVLVTAAANTGAARRTGTATVAGKTTTVDQAGTGGSGCTFQVSPTELTFFSTWQGIRPKTACWYLPESPLRFRSPILRIAAQRV